MKFREIYKQWPAWKKILVFVCIAAVVIAAALLIWDWQAKASYAKVEKEANRVAAFLPKAEGVIEVRNLGGNVSYLSNTGRGNGLLTEHCGMISIDVKCPEVTVSRLVLLPRGQEQHFFESMSKLSGYKKLGSVHCITDGKKTYFYDCTGGGTTSEFDTSLVLNVADPYHHGAPVEDDGVSPTVWRYFSVSVTTN